MLIIDMYLGIISLRSRKEM